MKTERNILFRLLFAVMILLCLGLEVMNTTSSGTSMTKPETTANTEDIHQQADTDFFDDDHITLKTDNFCCTDQPIHILNRAVPTHISDFIDSDWQPPRLS